MAMQGLASRAVNTMTFPGDQKIQRQKKYQSVELVEINQTPGEVSAAGKMPRHSPKEVCLQVRICVKPQQVDRGEVG